MSRSRCMKPGSGDRRLLLRLRIVAKKYGVDVAQVLWLIHKHEEMKAFAKREGITLEQAEKIRKGHLQ